MAVTIAENVAQHINNNERDKLRAFEDAPGYGGQRIRVKVASSKISVSHVTYGAGPSHVSVFYNRVGNDYQIVGVGAHDGKKGGKTAYSALWDGRGAGRVQVIVEGKS